MRVIVIAAGRGQRLMPTTARSPKCFAEVGGRRLLDWTLAAFAACGLDDVAFVGGYCIDAVRRDYPRLTFRHNAEWAATNVLDSLFRAEDLMDGPFICCYADVLFTPEVVTGLVATPGDIVLGIDTAWRARYADRTDHPPSDAEKVTVASGRVTRIHRAIDPAEAHGEFTGVARFSAAGAARLRRHYHRCRAAFAGRPWREAAVFERAYLIHLLQEMIEAGEPLAHADTAGCAIEIDTQQDFDYARRHWPLRQPARTA